MLHFTLRYGYYTPYIYDLIMYIMFMWAIFKDSNCDKSQGLLMLISFLAFFLRDFIEIYTSYSRGVYFYKVTHPVPSTQVIGPGLEGRWIV